MLLYSLACLLVQGLCGGYYERQSNFRLPVLLLYGCDRWCIDYYWFSIGATMSLTNFFERLKPHNLTRKQIVLGYRYVQGIDSYEILTEPVEGWSDPRPRIYPSELNDAVAIIKKLRLPMEREV